MTHGAIFTPDVPAGCKLARGCTPPPDDGDAAVRARGTQRVKALEKSSVPLP